MPISSQRGHGWEKKSEWRRKGRGKSKEADTQGNLLDAWEDRLEKEHRDRKGWERQTTTLSTTISNLERRISNIEREFPHLRALRMPDRVLRLRRDGEQGKERRRGREEEAEEEAVVERRSCRQTSKV